jgi:hypothetical protein
MIVVSFSKKRIHSFAYLPVSTDLTFLFHLQMYISDYQQRVGLYTTMNKITSSSIVITSSFINGHSILTDNEESKLSTTILWFESHISSYEYIEQVKSRLQRLNTDIDFYTDIELCLNFVRSTDKKKIILVTSGFSATKILPHIAKFCEIDTIFIICADKAKYEHLMVAYSKIIGIYTDLDLLCTFIRESIDFIDEQLLRFSFFNQHQKSKQYISKESAEFLWFQLFRHVILHLRHNQQAKNQMINMYQQYYGDNLTEQRLADREYRPEEAIYWYLKQSFISKFITKALRNQDIEQLHTARFFIIDLTENLAYEHQKILSSNEQIQIVYRGAKLSQQEWKKFRENEGALISMNGYLSAS